MRVSPTPAWGPVQPSPMARPMTATVVPQPTPTASSGSSNRTASSKARAANTSPTTIVWLGSNASAATNGITASMRGVWDSGGAGVSARSRTRAISQAAPTMPTAATKPPR